MTILGKKQMSEEDIKLNFITPAIQRGWKGHITMETRITDGRINIRGNIVVRSKPKFADYLLYLNDGKPIAVVEAKDNKKVGELDWREKTMCRWNDEIRNNRVSSFRVRSFCTMPASARQK